MTVSDLEKHFDALVKQAHTDERYATGLQIGLHIGLSWIKGILDGDLEVTPDDTQ